jgi:hypothetical protein
VALVGINFGDSSTPRSFLGGGIILIMPDKIIKTDGEDTGTGSHNDAFKSYPFKFMYN